MYFRYLHPYLPFLDKEHSAPSRIARRNNFLFNASECSSRDPPLLYLPHTLSRFRYNLVVLDATHE
jgi:hypothetical protein